MARDLREVLGVANGREPGPAAVILDGRRLCSTSESCRRAGYGGHERTQGSEFHAAVDTLGRLLAVRVTRADVQERARVADPAGTVQEASGDTVEPASVDSG